MSTLFGKPTPQHVQRDDLRQALEASYRERAHLVAHLAALYPSVAGYTDPAAPDWLVVTVELPSGQACWHIAARDEELVAHVRRVDAARWDGHTTEEKYARLREQTLCAAELDFYRVRTSDQQGAEQ